jgi:hypothetical protein
MLGTPKGLSDEKAARMVVALREGRTLRTFGVRTPRLDAYFKAHPEYAQEATPLIEANAKAAQQRKGVNRNLTHCKYGHSLADAYVSRQQGGYVKRDCRTCWAIRQKRPGVMRPEVAKQVEALLRKGMPISTFTKAGTKTYLVQHKTFTRFRLENPHVDQLFMTNVKVANSRGQRLRRLRNEGIREQNNDYYKIREMIPESNPHRGDIVARIFEDMLSGKLDRENVRTRVKEYVVEYNRMFPTNFAKFGDSKLVSLDEVLFDDGTMTRGDTVTWGLWD